AASSSFISSWTTSSRAASAARSSSSSMACARHISSPSFPRKREPRASDGRRLLGPRFRAGLSGENVCALQTSPRKELLNPPSSCPALCRASTPFFFRRQDVDGRDKPGHDDEGESSAAHLQPHLFPRTALRFRGDDWIA